MGKRGCALLKCHRWAAADPYQGPLKFILQAASTLTAAFENIVKTLGEIQLILPSFKKYKESFPQNDVIRQILLLFFEDILNLYSVLLNFATNSSQSSLIEFSHKVLMNNSGLRMFCEPFWPGVRTKVDKIREHMQSHKALMTEAVTVEDIVRAQKDRNLALAEYDRAQKFRDYQEFRAVRDEINPDTRYEKLDDIIRKATEGSGAWLDKEETFMNWLNPLDRTIRCFWICGIPGAGEVPSPKAQLRGPVLNQNRKDIPRWECNPTPAANWAMCVVHLPQLRTPVGWQDPRRSPFHAISGS